MRNRRRPRRLLCRAPTFQWGNTGCAFPNARAFSFIKQCFRQFESSQAAETPSTSQEETGASSESSDTEDETESAVPEGVFTPEGTGTVLTQPPSRKMISSFIPSPPRTEMCFTLSLTGSGIRENVYFLNGVTEEDLLSLAQQDNGSESAIEVVTCNCTEKCEAGAVNTVARSAKMT